MPRTEVTALSVISFLINSWHAVTEGRGILHLKTHAQTVIKVASNLTDFPE